MTECPKLTPWKYDVFVIGAFVFWSLFAADALRTSRISCLAQASLRVGFRIFDRKPRVFGQALTTCGVKDAFSFTHSLLLKTEGAKHITNVA